MNSPILRDLLALTRNVGSGRLTEVTSLLQRKLLDRDAPAQPVRKPTDPARGGGGQFLSAMFSNAAGSRPYRLHVPSGYDGQPVPLVVMLHGCSQSPDDFAAGTRMNAAAEAQTFLVAYPGQTTAANSSKCWNWFNPADQARERGEPALIAGITREVMRQYAVDPRRVYIAGLSAGGATAAIMAATYPDLYAAVGVHSGLPCGAARDLGSAFAAMHAGRPAGRHRAGRRLPTIVFHGDRDGTVNPANGDAVIADAMPDAALRVRVDQGKVPEGRAYTVTRHVDPDGKTVIEQVLIHGGIHGWSGGSEAGSFTDPRGPDATQEMLRFFLQHENASAA